MVKTFKVNKIVFFDHKYHEKTKSSSFFVDILKDLSTVKIIYVGDNLLDEIEAQITDNQDSDLYVFWQIMPPIQAISHINESKIVLIPMYDACCTMTYREWYKYRNYRFICFCEKIYHILENLGIKSLSVKYVPRINHDHMDVRKYDILTAFIWRRKESLNLTPLLNSMKKIGVKRVIIHNAPDYMIDKNNHYEINDLEVITTKGWFNTHDEYLNIISKCNVYIAPRLYEGIGLSFLEAFGLGLCVVAPNQATMNEYIIHGKNGLIFNSFREIRKCQFDIAELQSNSLIYYQRYLSLWEGSIPKIKCFILDNQIGGNNNFNSPYCFLHKDIIMFLSIRIIPFIKRKIKLNDY